LTIEREAITRLVLLAIANTAGGDRKVFADLLGITRANVNRYIRGQQIPNAYTCRRIAALGNISAVELLEASGHEPDAASHNKVELGLLAVANDYLAVPEHKRPALISAWKAVAAAVR
jgi:transcriptional regulator with XRE-family HTH domain